MTAVKNKIKACMGWLQKYHGTSYLRFFYIVSFLFLEEGNHYNLTLVSGTTEDYYLIWLLGGLRRIFRHFMLLSNPWKFSKPSKVGKKGSGLEFSRGMCSTGML